MTLHALDLYVVNGRTPDKAIIVAKRGADIAIEDFDIDHQVNTMVGLADRIDAAAAGAKRPTVTEMREMGSRLFQRVFTGQVGALYGRLPTGTAVSILVISNEPRIRRIPWEFIAPPEYKLLPHANRCVVRILPTCSGAELEPLKLKRPLRVLLAVAEPQDEAAVGWAEVEASIKTVFERFTRQVAKLTVVPATTALDLTAAFAKDRYDVFHFLGHGKVVDGVGTLVLLDVDSKASCNLSGTDLARILSGQELRLCILSACQSSTGDETSDFGSVASSLLSEGIPAVVANQASFVTDTVAPFVAAIYARLLSDGNVDNAVMSQYCSVS